MFTRGSSAHGILNTACEVPRCRGSPNMSQQKLNSSVYVTLCGLARILAISFACFDIWEWYHRRYYRDWR